MRTIILILAMFVGQFSYAQEGNNTKQDLSLYDRPFIENDGKCYCLNFETDMNIFPIKKEAGYLTLPLVDTWENIKNFELDEDRRPILPREVSLEKTIGYKYDFDQAYEDKVEAYTVTRTDLDTIFLYRDKVSNRLVLQKNKFPIWYYEVDDLNYGEVMCMMELPYEPYVFIVANNPDDVKYTQTARIELGPKDIVTTYQYQEVLCPSKFDQGWLEKIGNGLIKNGYLTDQVRTSFDKDVRSALYEFQRDHNIQVGYIDVKTAYLLGAL